MKTRTIMCAAAALIATIGMVQMVAQTSRVREDCIPYNPLTLRLTDAGERGWHISREDGARFIGLDTREDAEVMMAVFKAHSSLCYVGRDNNRPNRMDFVHHYWK